MSSLQLICPHCKSTLSFGLEVASGTVVACLICAKPFRVPAHAAPPVAALAPVPHVEERRPAPRAVMPVARPSAPAPPDSKTGQAVVLILLLLLVGGAGYVLWPGSEPEPTAAVAKAEAPPETAIVPESAPTSPASPPPEGPRPKPVEAVADAVGPEDEGRRTAEPKVVLKRRDTGGALEAPSLPVVATPTKREVPLSTAWGVEPARVNAAIERGVRYLKTSDWDSRDYPLGYQALAGLTLLECGVPADDPRVRQAAALVRRAAVGPTPSGHATYELSLSVLFLDRLGDPADRRTIQGISLRLLAAQSYGGGWEYHVPELTPAEMAELYRYLHSHRPPHLQAQLLGADRDAWSKDGPLQDPTNPYGQFAARVRALRIETPGDPAPKKDRAKPKEPLRAPKRLLAPLALQSLPAGLQGLPAVQLAPTRGRWTLTETSDDNSNTQFALLALWAARRHVVPVEDALLYAHQRFRTSQIEDGSWDYYLKKNGPFSPTMTGVGLLGIALGHGITAELKQAGGDRTKLDVEDPAIAKGLKMLGEAIGTPARGPTDPAPGAGNLYLMWTLERVAMLYDLKTIAGKDWYGWGAQALLGAQDTQGAWGIGGYAASTAHTDTCFALLFLKRSNLVQDLTENLRLYMAIRDPGRAAQ